MEEKTRRTFLKKAAVVSAAVGSTGGVSRSEAEQPDKATAVMLYHETSEWKRYYETLQ
ncbi:MAG: twin-arginine translocation signal domain-containing protein [Candidatus Latescibacterota bacterium]